MDPQGIYTMASYGKALQRQMEAISNNLANVETTGYKEDKPVFHSMFANSMGVPSQSNEEMFSHYEHLPPYSGAGTYYVSITDMGINYSQGRIINTGNDLDMALANPGGFFSINTPQGERFTRGGRFHLNNDKQLVTDEGFLVNGKEGVLKVEGNEILISEDGSMIVDGVRVGGMKIVTFPFPERLQKLGNSFFAQADPENNPRILEDVKMIQGSLETSNVESFKEMTRMIQATQAYTSMQKVLSSADEINKSAISMAEL